jgi:hypothetical protein
MRFLYRLAWGSALGTMLVGCSDTTEPASEAGSVVAEGSSLAGVVTLSISNIQANSGRVYQVTSPAPAVGTTLYTDRSYKYVNSVPSALSGATYIRTANADKSHSSGSTRFLSFAVNTDVTVYVAHDDRVPRPRWLTDSFQKTSMHLTSDMMSTPFTVFKRSFPKGTVVLGANSDASTVYAMYTVVVAASGSDAGDAPSDAPSDGGDTGTHAGFYVTPGGSATGDGSASRPWSLAAALAHPPAVEPGDTIWLRGGTYRGCYRSQLRGTATAPIIVRQYPGERAVIDNAACNDSALEANGAYTWYWGFEVMNSAARSGGPIGVNAFGQELKFINLVVHDAGDTGIGFWSQAVGGEVYGSIVYNNGRDHNLDHGIYTQNASGTKRLADNVIFNQMAFGIHAYGSDAAALRNYDIDGNTVFNNGSIDASAGEAPNILVGGGTAASGIRITQNVAYHRRNGSGNVWLGYSAQNQDLILENNYIAGGFTALRLWYWSSGRVSGNTIYTPDYYTINSLGNLGGLSWSGNTWHRPATLTAWSHANTNRDWAGWRSATGQGGSDQIGSATPTGVRTFVRPNRYERGRGHVVIFNWAGQSSVAVDVSSILRSGDRYEVRNVLQLNGSPVLSGSYSGGPLSFPMGAVSAPTPLGSGAVTGTGTGPEFQTFLITLVD